MTLYIWQTRCPGAHVTHPSPLSWPPAHPRTCQLVSAGPSRPQPISAAPSSAGLSWPQLAEPCVPGGSSPAPGPDPGPWPLAAPGPLVAGPAPAHVLLQGSTLISCQLNTCCRCCSGRRTGPPRRTPRRGVAVRRAAAGRRRGVTGPSSPGDVL